MVLSTGRIARSTWPLSTARIASMSDLYGMVLLLGQAVLAANSL